MAGEIRVLLVDDNPGDLLLMKLALSEAGLVYIPTVFDDGANALAHLSRVFSGAETERPELVLLDLNLPKVTGLDILRELRSLPASAAVPALVLSASESPRDKEAALALGATAFLIKPSDLRAVHTMGQKIRDVLERAAVGPAAE